MLALIGSKLASRLLGSSINQSTARNTLLRRRAYGVRRDRCQCGCCPTQWQSPCNPTPNFSLGLSAGSQTRLCAISALGPAARVIAAGATGKAGHIGYRKWFNGKLCVNEMAAYLYFRAGTGRRPTVFASELAKTFGWSRPTGRCPSSLIPHSPPHRRRSASRDFVPWRFSDASRQRAWRGSSCRCPRTCTGAHSTAPRGLQHEVKRL